MVGFGPQALAEVKAALEDYKEEVGKSKLSQKSQQTYLLHAKNFVRWLYDDFKPGGTLK